MVLLLVLAVLIHLTSATMVCWCSFSLASVKFLEKTIVMAVLCDSGFDMALGYMADCCSRDVNWQQCTSTWSRFHFSVNELSNVLLRSPCLTRHRSSWTAQK